MNEDQQQQQRREYRPVAWWIRQLVIDFEELARMSDAEKNRYSGGRA